MAEITIGYQNTTNYSLAASGRTVIHYLDTSGCSGDGTIDTFNVHMSIAGTGVKLGTFIAESPLATSRDYVTVGDTSTGINTFTGLSIDAMTGDRAGVYNASGNVYCDSGEGWSRLWKAGDYFGAGEQTYTLNNNYAPTIWGTGTEISGHPAIKRFGGVPFCTQRRNIW